MNDPNVFDPKLIQRLTRPLVKPGVINLGMARGIILRSQSFVNRLPLLAIAQRHYNISESKTEQLPIVYAQSRLPQAEIGSNLSLQGDRQVSQSNPSQTTVVQAKFISSTSPTAADVNPQVVTKSENPTNPLPLVTSLPSDLANSESIPIVYAKSQSPETVTARDISLQHNVNRQNAENNDNQTTIVQAKFSSPTSPTTTNVNPQVINQSENTSNSLPLVTSLPSDSANSESIPIVYAKSQSPETVTASDISLQPNVNILNPQSNDSQTRVVQAKFASPTAPTTTDVNPQVVNQSVVTQPQNQTNSLPLVSPLPLINSTPDDKGQNLTPQPPSLRGKGGQDLLISLSLKEEENLLLPSSSRGEENILLASPVREKQNILRPSPFRGGAGGGVKYDSIQKNIGWESLPIVYAKYLQSPKNPISNRDNFESRQIPIIYIKSHENNEINKLNNPILTANVISRAAATIPPPLPKFIVQANSNNSAKVDTPLVFSNPSVTLPQTTPEVAKREIDKFSNTSSKSTIAPVTSHPSTSPNLRQQITHSQEVIPQIDINALAAKVERKLMRKLVIENERRGRKL